MNEARIYRILRLVWAVVVILILIYFIHTSSANSYGQTYEKYEQQIIYYDFSKIPDDLALDKKIELSSDLRRFINHKWHNPRIENSERFEQEVWEEAGKLGYTPEKLAQVDIKQAVMAAVEIVASRLSYYLVDSDQTFIVLHGEFRSTDFYFHLGLGDCDKYANATIGVFKIIKKLNPQLQNVYLSREALGGNIEPHAWVSIVILQKDYLLLSHIDPTFYDSSGVLEADEFHVCLEHKIFISCFYKALGGCKNMVYAYLILEQELLNTKNPTWRREILKKMMKMTLYIEIYKPKVALDKIIQAAEQYKDEGFIEDADVLYYLYKVYLGAGKKVEAEAYRQRLINEFPNSFWVRCVKKTNAAT